MASIYENHKCWLTISRGTESWSLIFEGVTHCVEHHYLTAGSNWTSPADISRLPCLHLYNSLISLLTCLLHLDSLAVTSHYHSTTTQHPGHVGPQVKSVQPRCRNFLTGQIFSQHNNSYNVLSNLEIICH